MTLLSSLALRIRNQRSLSTTIVPMHIQNYQDVTGVSGKGKYDLLARSLGHMDRQGLFK